MDEILNHTVEPLPANRAAGVTPGTVTPGAPHHVFLIDGSGFIFRAYYARARSSEPVFQRKLDGMVTEVVTLFSNMLDKYRRETDADHMAVIFDASGTSFRNRIYDAYKANRREMPEDLRPQLEHVRRAAAAFDICQIELPDFEADDLIATYARHAVEAGAKVTILSSDKDMMQLVNAGVKILRTGTGGAKADTIVDAKKVQEILGVTPDKVIDLMALLGDTVDNIPGAKGIGEKGATELIQKYGSVENALEHAAEVPNKRYREALQQQVDQVKLSKQLAAIAMDVPLELDTEKLKAREPDVAALTVLYRELGFNSLLKELLAAGAAPQQGHIAPATLGASTAVDSATAQAPRDYAQLANAAEFRAYLKKLGAKDSLAIWLNLEPGERGTEGFGTRIASIEVSSKAGEGRAVWMDNGEEIGRAHV